MANPEHVKILRKDRTLGTIGEGERGIDLENKGPETPSEDLRGVNLIVNLIISLTDSPCWVNLSAVRT